MFFFFFFSSRRRHTRLQGDWSSDVCSSDLDRPSPLAQNDRDFFEERLAAAIIALPGENSAPAQPTGALPAATLPEMSRHPLLPCAPPAAILIWAADFPPIIASVEIIHPAPNLVSGFSCSTSLTSPLSEPAGGAAAACPLDCSFSFSTAARKLARSAGTPSFHTPAISRVARMSLAGSPFTTSRARGLPGPLGPGSSQWENA